MYSRTSSLSSISDLFRPNNPKGLTSRDLSTTRLSIFKKEIQTDAHLISLSVVLCCGDLTALGRVAGLAARLEPAPSPLSREIRRFMRYISIWALCLGIFIAGAGIFLGYPIMQTIIFVIGIVVANIPEGMADAGRGKAARLALQFFLILQTYFRR